MLGIRINLDLLDGWDYTKTGLNRQGYPVKHQLGTVRGADGKDYITDIDPETSDTLWFWGAILKALGQVIPIVDLDQNGEFVVVEFELPESPESESI